MLFSNNGSVGWRGFWFEKVPSVTSRGKVLVSRRTATLHTVIAPPLPKLDVHACHAASCAGGTDPFPRRVVWWVPPAPLSTQPSSHRDRGWGERRKEKKRKRLSFGGAAAPSA
ncbi:hypothetical protein CGRA01v4_11011 [Colletotrichum graminicola]|nr:hypothetical protein CGRA01v4_11011 [Colletotrichum graminicola]